MKRPLTSLLTVAALFVAPAAFADEFKQDINTGNIECLLSKPDGSKDWRRMTEITLVQPAMVKNALAYYRRKSSDATFEEFQRCNPHLEIMNVETELAAGTKFNIPTHVLR